jgi:hypothetical protein
MASRCSRPAWSSTAITRRTRVDQRRCQRAASGAQVEHQITGTHQRGPFDRVVDLAGVQAVVQLAEQPVEQVPQRGLQGSKNSAMGADLRL